MITGILFHDGDLEENLKVFLWEGMKTFKKKYDLETTTIALNKKQFEIETFKPTLALFEKKGIAVLLLDDINKNHYQIGRSDKFLSQIIQPKQEKRTSEPMEVV